MDNSRVALGVLLMAAHRLPLWGHLPNHTPCVASAAPVLMRASTYHLLRPLAGQSLTPRVPGPLPPPCSFALLTEQERAELATSSDEEWSIEQAIDILTIASH